MIEDGTRFIWGAQSVPYQVPDWLMQPLSVEYFFLTGYRVFMVVLVAVAVAGLFLILTRTRLGIRIRAGTLDLETVSVLGVNVRILRNLNFGLGIYLAGLAGVLAAGMLGLQPVIGTSLIMPSFVAIIVGGLGSLPRDAFGRTADRRRLGNHDGVLALGHRGDHLRHDGSRAAGPPTRPAGRGRQVLSGQARQQAGRERHHLAAAAGGAVLDAVDRRLYRTRQPRAGLSRWPPWR